MSEEPIRWLSWVGRGDEGNERAKAHLVMDLVMNALSAVVRADINWTAAAT
jgi:hypothetical protein